MCPRLYKILTQKLMEFITNIWQMLYRVYKIFGAGLKLITFTSMVNRIINTSRN